MSRDHVRDALLISYAAAAWSLVAGVASVVIGVLASSTALLGTGADVVADLVSSLVLIWRFRGELHGEHLAETVERRAHRVSSSALVVVGVGIGATAIVRLANAQGASPQASAIAVAGASVLVLPVFGAVKYRIAGAVPSGALRMDGHITMVGATMAAITLVGLAVTGAFGWSAADPIAALGVAIAAGVTGVQGIRTA